MAILTIYNHGTDGSSKKPEEKKEIINCFGNAHALHRGSQYKYIEYLINEGIGSADTPHHTTFLEGSPIDGMRYLEEIDVAIPRNFGDHGLFRRFRSHKIVAASDANAEYEGLMEMRPVWWSTRRILRNAGGNGEKYQSVSGFGIEQNVMRAVALVDFLATHDPGSRAIFPDGQVRTIPKIDAVNLIGWSRGAVTCFKIAYQLSQNTSTRNIKVHIFGIDPVAGMGQDKAHDVGMVASNVKKVITTRAIHENRGGFLPTIMTIENPTETTSCMCPIPGVHDNTAKMQSAAGFITAYMAGKFLMNVGTTAEQNPAVVNAGYVLDEEKICQCIDSLVCGSNLDQVAFGLTVKGKEMKAYKAGQSVKKRIFGGGHQSRSQFANAGAFGSGGLKFTNAFTLAFASHHVLSDLARVGRFSNTASAALEALDNRAHLPAHMSEDKVGALYRMGVLGRSTFN